MMPTVEPTAGPTGDGADLPGSTPTRHGGGTRSRLRYAARLALTVVILAGLFTMLGTDDLSDVIGRVGIVPFLVSGLINIGASIVLPAVVSRVSVRRTGLDLGLGKLVVINFTIRFYTLILPRAAATGMRWLKYRAAGTGGEAAALVVLEKLVQIFIYAISAALFVALEAATLDSATGPLLLIAALLIVPSGIGLAAVFTDRLDSVLGLFTFATRIPVVGRAAEVVASAVVTQRGMRVRQLLSIGGWSVIGYALFVLSAAVIASELDVGVSLVALAWIRGLVFLGTLIPITIAGAGVREAGFVGFLRLYDVPDATALGFALVLLGVQIAIGAVGGLIELAGWIKRRDRGSNDPTMSTSKEAV